MRVREGHTSWATLGHGLSANTESPGGPRRGCVGLPFIEVRTEGKVRVVLNIPSGGVQETDTGNHHHTWYLKPSEKINMPQKGAQSKKIGLCV